MSRFRPHRCILFKTSASAEIIPNVTCTLPLCKENCTLNCIARYSSSCSSCLVLFLLGVHIDISPPSQTTAGEVGSFLLLTQPLQLSYIKSDCGFLSFPWIHIYSLWCFTWLSFLPNPTHSSPPWPKGLMASRPL